MARRDKRFAKALNNSRGLRFDEFRALVDTFGYRLGRISDSHHIYYHPDVPSPLNIQPDKNGMAKAYQVHDFLEDVRDYLGDEEAR